MYTPLYVAVKAGGHAGRPPARTGGCGWEREGGRRRPPRSRTRSRLVAQPPALLFFPLQHTHTHTHFLLFLQLRRDTYSRLTPVQRLQVARHPNRPTFLDIALNISDKFVELHGDRAGLDDPAMVCGLASMGGVSFMFIGHQKGRNTKENIYRNFGMPQPNGYRKALRFMRHADHFGFPIVTFVDTPGAYAGKAAEELGQGEAIAVNLREMFGFRVPIISVVIGEGGSGGALAIGCVFLREKGREETREGPRSTHAPSPPPTPPHPHPKKHSPPAFPSLLTHTGAPTRT